MQFLDVVIDLMTHIYDKLASTSTREVRQMLIQMDGRMEFHHDLAVTRLAALQQSPRNEPVPVMKAVQHAAPLAGLPSTEAPHPWATA